MTLRKGLWRVMIFFCAFSISPFAKASFARGTDENWVALHVYDSFYPIDEERSFPENLNSLEVMFNFFYKRKIAIDFEKIFGVKNRYGLRSREGHYVIWVHLSEHFLKKNAVNRKALGDGMFLYPNRDSDILTGWSGSVNIAALLREGVKGLGTPVIINGKPVGQFNTSKDLFALGDADYEAGWFMNDDQASKILNAFHTYPGIAHGYSFLRLASERPNFPYDPPQAQLVNGYNCGDFAFYALTEAGVVSRDEVESLKVRFWYPDRYFDRALPLSKMGVAGRLWLDQHPESPVLPDNKFTELGWFDLFFGKSGIEFFNKQKLFDETWQGELKYYAARIWDQSHAIAWLRKRADFQSKGIATELQVAAKRGVPILEPYRRVQENNKNRYILSKEHDWYEDRCISLERKKLLRSGIDGEMKTRFRNTVERDKIRF